MLRFVHPTLLRSLLPEIWSMYDTSQRYAHYSDSITASKRKSRYAELLHDYLDYLNRCRSSHDAYSKNLRLASRYQSPWPGCFKKAKWQLGDVFSKGYRKMDKYFPTCRYVTHVPKTMTITNNASVVETIPLRRLRKLSMTPEQMDQSSVSRLHLGIVWCTKGFGLMRS